MRSSSCNPCHVVCTTLWYTILCVQRPAFHCTTMLGTTLSNEYTEITVGFVDPKMFATDNMKKLSDM